MPSLFREMLVESVAARSKLRAASELLFVLDTVRVADLDRQILRVDASRRLGSVAQGQTLHHVRCGLSGVGSDFTSEDFAKVIRALDREERVIVLSQVS